MVCQYGSGSSLSIVTSLNTSDSAVTASGTIARLASGVLADYFPPFRIAAISLTLSGLAAFLIWGLAATTFGALMAFSTVFGLAATGFTSLASGVIKDLAGIVFPLPFSARLYA